MKSTFSRDASVLVCVHWISACMGPCSLSIWSRKDHRLSLFHSPAQLGTSQHTVFSEQASGHHDIKNICTYSGACTWLWAFQENACQRDSGSAAEMGLGRLTVSLRFKLSSPSGCDRFQIMPCQPPLWCQPPKSSSTLPGCNLSTFPHLVPLSSYNRLLLLFNCITQMLWLGSCLKITRFLKMFTCLKE